MNFPKLVYKSASLYVVVNDDDEVAQKLAEGWFETVPEALAPKDAARIGIDAPPTRDELKRKAGELGIEFQSNIPTDKLADLVAAELAPKE